MAKVIGQDRTHPLFALLSKQLDCQTDITHTTVRTRPRKRSDLPRSVLSELGRHIFAHCVDLWYALPEEAKEWYNNNAPPQYCTGFLWWTWSCLVKNYGGGPWTVNVSEVGGHCYIAPRDAPEGIFAKGYTGATEIGTLAHIDWVPGCPGEDLPLLLVHGWYPEAFDPADTWKVMTYELTGKDPTKAGDYQLVYDPEHPGDPNYALVYVEGDERDVYISNYTHEPENGTPGDIRRYAQSLAREIEVLKGHLGAPAVDILSHSMGGLVARAYIENQDFAPNPYPTPYRGDVRGLIMIAPPNQGSHFYVLYPGWHNWASVEQMKAGSEFLAQLNSGTTGAAQGVEYSIIAGNKYDCRQWGLVPSDPGNPFAVNTREGFVVPGIITHPPHADRLCEYTNNEPNDSEILVAETKLDKQDGQIEVPPERYYVYKMNHWDMRGYWGQPCRAAQIVKIILANYTIAKWRRKGKQFEPSEENEIQRALRLISQTDAASEVYNHIMSTNVSIDFYELPGDTIAQYNDLTNTIEVNRAAEAKPKKVLAQYIVHEGEHSRWYPVNSIYQEYHACKAEADFWNAVKKGDADDMCDWVAGFIGQGKEAAMDYLHSLPKYAHLPRYAKVDETLEDGCAVLDDDPVGHELFIDAQRMGLEVRWGSPEYDVMASYDLSQKKGIIHTDYQTEPPEVIAAVLAYLCARAAWDIEDSIHQEYSTYFQMARIWRSVRNGLTHHFLDFVAHLWPRSMPDNLSRMEVVKDWLRWQDAYAGLPNFFPPLD